MRMMTEEHERDLERLRKLDVHLFNFFGTTDPAELERRAAKLFAFSRQVLQDGSPDNAVAAWLTQD